MEQLHSFIAIAGVSQGLLILMLFGLDRRVPPATRLLGLQGLVVASGFVAGLTLTPIWPEAWSGVFAWTFPIASALGPLSYLHGRVALGGRGVQWRDLLHFLPVLLIYLTVLDKLVFAPSDVTSWVLDRDTSSTRFRLSSFARLSVAIGYTLGMGHMVWRARQQANDGSCDSALIRFTTRLFFLHLGTWGIAILGNAGVAPEVLRAVCMLTALSLCYFILVSHWRNPALFGADRKPTNTNIPLTEEDAAPDRVGEASYGPNAERSRDEGGALDPDIREKLFAEIETAFESRQLYLDGELTLGGLAQELGFSTHHLSEVLNKHAGKNFYEFLNGYRVAHARRLLVEEPTLRVIDVAMESGFSSKSSFNAIFKRSTGLTPTALRRTALAENAVSAETCAA